VDDRLADERQAKEMLVALVDASPDRDASTTRCCCCATRS
jgi:hypothetical protein